MSAANFRHEKRLPWGIVSIRFRFSSGSRATVASPRPASRSRRGLPWAIRARSCVLLFGGGDVCVVFRDAASARASATAVPERAQGAIEAPALQSNRSDS